jgi:hypothetical protein
MGARQGWFLVASRALGDLMGADLLCYVGSKEFGMPIRKKTFILIAVVGHVRRE